MKIKKWIFIVLILAVIGSFLPDDESENVPTSVSSEETKGLEEDGHEKSQEDEKEALIFSEDSRTNRDIADYNKQNPENPVVLDMVENWETGDGIATRVTFDGFCIQFGHNEGDPAYAFWSDNDNNKKNKDAFIDESLKWIKVIFHYDKRKLNSIRNRLSENSTEIKFDITTNSNLTYLENGMDYYLKYHKYVIKISPKPW